jgi:hypothetical protein
MMRRALDGLTALVPVGIASLLIAFCLAGAQLYSSSSGSAALDTQLAETCRSDSALTLPIPPNTLRADEQVAEIGSVVPFVDPARRWVTARPFLQTGAALPRRLTMLWIEGVDEQVTPVLQPLGLGEIALSTGNVAQLETEIGGVVRVDGGQLTVAQQFDDVPFAPIPDFWCGYPELLTPTAGGDRAPPYAIASPETIAMFGASRFDEYRVVDEPLTLTDAAALREGYAAATEMWTSRFPEAPIGVERNELERIVARATSVRTSVDRNLAPVTLTGVVAGSIVLVAAAVLVARDRRRELRLLAVRGLPPPRIALHVAPRAAVVVGIGMLTGALLAWSVVAAAGPSSNLESGALARSAAWVSAALVLSVAAVAGVVGYVADGFADVRRRRMRTGWIAVAVLLAVVALAVVAFRRLDGGGAVRTFGVESRGGDLLAMGFPLFGLLAVTAVVGLVVGSIAPKLRLSGARLRRSVRLGWRRVVLETGPLVAVVVSVGLAAGCFVVARALADGSERQLADKAEVYVGTDLAIGIYDEFEIPDDWDSPTTLVSSVDTKWGELRADLMGIEQDFPATARMRSDAASQSLDELVASVAPGFDGEALVAVAVGSDAEVGDVVSLELPGRSIVDVEVVATAAFFPRTGSNMPMFVVDRAALDEVASFPRTTLLVRDPPPDAVADVRAAGVRTSVVLSAVDAFEGSGYSALRWAYAPLAALGVLFAVVALALQLLVVAARRDQRRIADAVMRRTGFTRRGLWWASIVETGVPLVIGSLVGIVAAVLAASLAVERLDPMPALAPPAEFAVPWDVMLGIACVVPLWTAAIAWLIVRSTVKTDPMRVFQGAV